MKMKPRHRRMAWIFAIIAAVHGAGFWALSSCRPMPPREPFRDGQFEVRRSEVTDPKTGEKTRYREYTVSTKLTDDREPSSPQESQK